MAKRTKMPKKDHKKQEIEKAKTGKLPFWLQIVLILLCGVILSGVAYAVIHNKIEADREKNEAAREAEKPRYTVTFAYQDGTVIDTRQVKEGAGTFPPDFETDGVFQGWSAGFNEVMSDLETHPMVYNITEDENLFCFDAVYVQEGKQFTIDLRLAGHVYISSAELRMEYDPEVMDYIEASDTDHCIITKEEDGKLNIKVSSDVPLTESCLLSSITFRAKQKDVYSTQINLSCISGALSVDEKESPATVSTINNKIYYLQEVSQ